MSTSSLSAIGSIFVEPSATFSKLKDKPSPWVPLLLMVLLSAAVMFWWVATLDFHWMAEHIAASKPDLPPEARAQMAQFLTPTTMHISTQTGIVLGTVIAIALTALYYLLAGKLMGSGIGYGKWFGFAAWTAVPRLLALPLMALQIATSHGQVAAEDLNMLSLNFLIFHIPQGHPWAGMLSGIDLTMIWSLVLATFGLKAWTGRGTGACAFAAILPYALIYGVWAAWILKAH